MSGQTSSWLALGRRHQVAELGFRLGSREMMGSRKINCYGLYT